MRPPPVSAVPLSCAFLALLSQPSHQIAGVDSISLVISLGAFPTRPTYPPKATTQRNSALGKTYPQREAPILPLFGAPDRASMV
jgi:hypothetical protein